MIYVLEVPHRGEPRAWVADDSADYMRKARKQFSDWQHERFSEWSLTRHDLRDVVVEVAASGSDVSGYWVCDDKASALELCAFLESGIAPRVGQCGPVVAAAVLRSRLPL